MIIGLFSGMFGEEFSIDITELVLEDNSVIIDTDGNVQINSIIKIRFFVS